MNLGQQISYIQLLQRHTHIQIPIIQRDYAQGRPDEQEVRDSFLAALEDALLKPAHDTSLPLNLDFIYGSVEVCHGKTHFLPLDGQQRLTTLFLLHWYLAWHDDAWEVFTALFVADGKSRFCYGVRPSSNDFFDQLVAYRPTEAVDEVASLATMLCDQPWFFRSWLRDPTIQSVLGMVNAIHKRFATHSNLFARLTDEVRLDAPAAASGGHAGCHAGTRRHCPRSGAPAVFVTGPVCGHAQATGPGRGVNDRGCAR